MRRCVGPGQDPYTGVWDICSRGLEPSEEDCIQCQGESDRAEDLQGDMERERAQNEGVGSE